METGQSLVLASIQTSKKLGQNNKRHGNGINAAPQLENITMVGQTYFKRMEANLQHTSYNKINNNS